MAELDPSLKRIAEELTKAVDEGSEAALLFIGTLTILEWWANNKGMTPSEQARFLAEAAVELAGKVESGELDS